MIKLERPLCIIDFETTGVDTATAKIVQVGLIRTGPKGPNTEVSQTTWNQLVNPGIPIPEDATEIHGIKDEDVKDKPFFHQVAPQLSELLKGADLCGYSIITFDLPLLEAEFARTPVFFSREGRHIVDALRIFQQEVPHTLEGAVKYYMNCNLIDAHDAFNGAEATRNVLRQQIAVHDLPNTIPELAKKCIPDDYVTPCGKLRYNKDGEITLGFGKYKGKLLTVTPPDYLQWIIMKDFPPDVKKHCEDALRAHAGG